jgi:hypothetical protein
VSNACEVLAYRTGCGERIQHRGHIEMSASLPATVFLYFQDILIIPNLGAVGSNPAEDNPFKHLQGKF